MPPSSNSKPGFWQRLFGASPKKLELQAVPPTESSPSTHNIFNESSGHSSPKELTLLVENIADIVAFLISDCYNIRGVISNVRGTTAKDGATKKDVLAALDHHRTNLLLLLDDDTQPPELSIMWFLVNALNVAKDVSYVATIKIKNYEELKSLVAPAAKRVADSNSHSDQLLAQEEKVADAWRVGSLAVTPYFKRHKVTPIRVVLSAYNSFRIFLPTEFLYPATLAGPSQARQHNSGLRLPTGSSNLIESITMLHNQLRDELSSFAQFWNDQFQAISRLSNGRQAMTNSELEEYIKGWTKARAVLRSAKEDIGKARDSYVIV